VRFRIRVVPARRCRYSRPDGLIIDVCLALPADHERNTHPCTPKVVRDTGPSKSREHRAMREARKLGAVGAAECCAWESERLAKQVGKYRTRNSSGSLPPIWFYQRMLSVISESAVSRTRAKYRIRYRARARTEADTGRLSRNQEEYPQLFDTLGCVGAGGNYYRLSTTVCAEARRRTGAPRATYSGAASQINAAQSAGDARGPTGPD
jgi:hypothetical protein